MLPHVLPARSTLKPHAFTRARRPFLSLQPPPSSAYSVICICFFCNAILFYSNLQTILFTDQNVSLRDDPGQFRLEKSSTDQIALVTPQLSAAPFFIVLANHKPFSFHHAFRRSCVCSSLRPAIHGCRTNTDSPVHLTAHPGKRMSEMQTSQSSLA